MGSPSGGRTPLSVRLRVLGGARQGLDVVRVGRTLVLGRHPDADLRLDPERDLEVSARHAVLERHGGRWTVTDLGSRNGTFLNGDPVTVPTRVESGDRIRLGAGGPEVEVVLEMGRVGAVGPAGSAGVEDTAPAHAGSGTDGGRGPGTTARIRVRVARETRRLRWAGGALVVLLLAAVGGLLWRGGRQQEGFQRERRELEARIDSVLRASRATTVRLRDEVQGLAAALEASRAEVEEVRSALRRATDSPQDPELPELRRRLQEATTALTRQQLAAGLDFDGIRDRNASAVALIWVERAPGEVVTATAFAVRPDGTLVTNRHVVLGPEGDRRPRRIAVQLGGSDRVRPARLLAASDRSDLALVRIDDGRAEVPTVQGLNLRSDTLREGDPVALLGYPLGGAASVPEGSGDAVARPLVSAGVVSRVGSRVLELQGYGQQGASGSPVLDARGEVVGILYGGRTGEGGRRVLAVPAAALEELLAAVP